MVDAVKANTSPTLPAKAIESVVNAKAKGTRAARRAATRNPRTLPPRRSWLMTPASETTNPDVVERNAANAPATNRSNGAPPVKTDGAPAAA